MTNKDILLGLAARLDQVVRELEAFGKRQDISFWASHEAGVVSLLISTASRKLTQLSNRV